MQYVHHGLSISLYTVIIGACIKKRDHRDKSGAEAMGSSVAILHELQDENENLFWNDMRMNIKVFILSCQKWSTTYRQKT